MRRGKDASLKALISAMAEAESKSYYEEQENALNDLSGLLKTFLNRDDSPERVRIRKDYEAGAALTGKGGIRQRLGAVDMEFFGRAYFPHYFSRPSPEFHRELDAIWQDGVLKGLTPSTSGLVKQISRMNGCKRVVAAPRGHAKSTSLTFKERSTPLYMGISIIRSLSQIVRIRRRASWITSVWSLKKTKRSGKILEI